MNVSLMLIIVSILIAGIVLFWLFYRHANYDQKLSKDYLIKHLAVKDVTPEKRTEMENQLSQLLQNHQQQYSPKTFILITAFIVPMSVLLYLNIGNPQAINYKPSSTDVNNSQSPPQMSMQDAIKQLEEKLEANPDDVEGQVLYARSQVSLKNFEKAVIAYRKANELAPNEAVILTELAESIALFNNNRSFLGEPEGLLKKAVEIDNSNQKALWLYGMTFYEKQEFEKANELWTSLYDLMTNENAKKQLLDQLVDVRSRLGENTDQQTQVPSQLNAIISLDESLKSQMNKQATLFLYTKATSGMPMPIAVIKKPLELNNISFPLNLSISDLNNLQANRKLSEFERIIIGARISFSGDATAQAGDLESDEIEIELPYPNTIELLINNIK
ncbi:MAG: tetratricopeptide repeat protein [Marinicellaceae bacterium]